MHARIEQEEHGEGDRGREAITTLLLLVSSPNIHPVLCFQLSSGQVLMECEGHLRLGTRIAVRLLPPSGLGPTMSQKGAPAGLDFFEHLLAS